MRNGSVHDPIWISFDFSILSAVHPTDKDTRSDPLSLTMAYIYRNICDWNCDFDFLPYNIDICFGTPHNGNVHIYNLAIYERMIDVQLFVQGGVGSEKSRIQLARYTSKYP